MMKEGEAPRIITLKDASLEGVVRIHIAGLGYTLNSRLGRDHMKFLYQAMANDPSCYVGVARVNDRLAGVVSGSVDAGRFASRLFRAMSGRQLARIAGRMLLRPQLIWLWWQTMVIAAPIQIESVEVKAVLTAIAVDEQIQGKGIGRALVAAFESFLRQQGIGAYKLDTQAKNVNAIRFYAQLGFRQAARRADSVVLVRRLSG